MIRSAVTLTALLVAMSAAAQSSIKCEAPQGWTYAFERPGHWVQDGLSEGTISLVQAPSGEWDVVYETASNRFTAKEDGARLTVAKDEGRSGSLIIVATYPLGTVETFHLIRSEAAGGSLAITSAKPSIDAPARSSLFVSNCGK